jgi:hypothetical protein
MQAIFIGMAAFVVSLTSERACAGGRSLSLAIEVQDCGPFLNRVIKKGLVIEYERQLTVA